MCMKNMTAKRKQIEKKKCLFTDKHEKPVAKSFDKQSEKYCWTVQLWLSKMSQKMESQLVG